MVTFVPATYIKKVVTPSYMDIDENTQYKALIRAIVNDRLDIVKFLVRHGVNIYGEQEYPLQLACIAGRLSIVKYLFSKGTDFCNNTTALYFACAHNRMDCVRFLVEKKVPVDDETHNVMKILSCHGHLDLLKYFHEEIGLALNCLNGQVVYKLCYHGHLKSIQYVFSKHPLQTFNTDRVIRYAIISHYVQVFQYLYSNKDIPWINYDLLEHIADHGSPDMMKIVFNRMKEQGNEIDGISCVALYERTIDRRNISTSFFLEAYCKRMFGMEFRYDTRMSQDSLSKFFTSFYTRSLSPPSFSSLVDEPMYEPHLGFLVASYIE